MLGLSSLLEPMFWRKLLPFLYPEILVMIYETTHHYILGDSNLHSHHCDNIKPHII